MRPTRWAFRALLLLGVLALVAGCTSPRDDDRTEESVFDDPNQTTETPGCIEEGQTGDGTGDIAADQLCPPDTRP